MSGENERDGVSLPDNLSEMLDKVLSNPELIASVASALSASSGKESSGGEADKKSVETSAPAELSEKLPEIMSALKPMLGSHSSERSREAEKRACLLNAVKPYVSPQRCEAIDYMIKFSRLAELMRNMN